MATVTDLRNDFKKVSAWLEVGEKVEITKRGKPYAVLTKAVEPLHLATAIRLGVENFLTFDRKQKEMAESEGLIAPV